MASTIIEAPDVLQATQSIPSQALNVCNNAPGWYGTGNCAGGKGAVGGPECDCDAGDQCNTIFNSGGDGAMGALVAGHEEVVVGDGVGESVAEEYGLQANPQKAEKMKKKRKVSRRKCECDSGKKEGKE
jgi:iron transport multicopper oxidase